MKVEELLRAFSVPEEFIESRPGRQGVASFHNYRSEYNNDTKLIEQIIQSAKELRWLIICSPVSGRGKSHLAVAAMRLSYHHDQHPVRRNKEVNFEQAFLDPITMTSYPPKAYRFLSVRRTGQELAMAGVGLPKMLDSLLNHKRCLLLDELGLEPDSAISRIELILEDVFNSRGQIIATTPLTPEQLIARYNLSIIRRIEDRGEIISLPGGQTFRVEENQVPLLRIAGG